MHYKLITFGCQMNISDSERIATILKKMKYTSTLDENKANLILVNACSVKQKAINRIFGQMKNWKKLKEKNPSLIIGLTGCITEKDKKKFKDKVDLIFDIKELPELEMKIKKLIKNNIEISCKIYSKQNKKNQDDDINYFHIEPKYSNKNIGYLPIMTGCNNFCSYCIVPYTRGPEISRPVKEILQEIKNLIKKKYKKIFLLGQNVNSYQSKLNNEIFDFPKLLKLINQIPGNFKINFLTSHPKDMSDELINVMAKSEKIKKELHLPIQSGDNEILKKMNRKYTVQDYLKLVQKIRKQMPNIFLSTDVIVGFPGETNKQFNNTVKLFKKIKFNKAYISQYSPRPQTAAAKLDDDVSNEEKKRRWKILNDLINKK